MAGVELSIVEPENDAAFTEVPTVTFRGKLKHLPPELKDVSFFYRWYSSLYPGAQREQYSMNVTALTEAGAPFSCELGMGSHVITFAASDQAGETDTDFEAIQHGGVTGGLEGDNRCVIHVFKANIIEPSNGEIPQAGLILQAEAPPLWHRRRVIDSEPPENSEPPEYEFNNDYHEYNRLRYRWRFEPVGSSTGRPTLEFIPDPKDLDFDPESDPVCVAYQPPLPAAATGNYRIVLYVEDKLDEGIGQHQDEVFVNLT